jgi:hypothetical protein
MYRPCDHMRDLFDCLLSPCQPTPSWSPPLSPAPREWVMMVVDRKRSSTSNNSNSWLPRTPKCKTQYTNSLTVNRTQQATAAAAAWCRGVLICPHHNHTLIDLCVHSQTCIKARCRANFTHGSVAAAYRRLCVKNMLMRNVIANSNQSLQKHLMSKVHGNPMVWAISP